MNIQNVILEKIVAAYNDNKIAQKSFEKAKSFVQDILKRPTNEWHSVSEEFDGQIKIVFKEGVEIVLDVKEFMVIGVVVKDDGEKSSLTAEEKLAITWFVKELFSTDELGNPLLNSSSVFDY